MLRLRTLLVVLGTVVLFSGCVSLLEPRQSNIQYYVLGSPEAMTSIEAPGDTAGLSVGLRRVQIADYLDAPALVTRRGSHTIRFADFHRWGEDLARAINRTLAARLVAQTGVGQATVVPFTTRDRHDYLVQLNVLRFEGAGPPPLGPDEEPPDAAPVGGAHMTIAWEVIDPETESVLTRGITRHQEDDWTVNDYADLVAKLDASITVLAQDLAARLQERP